MKISQKQASLLAGEVLRQLKKANTFEVPAHTVAKLEDWKDKADALLLSCKKADDAYSKHEAELKKITNNYPNIYGSNTVSQMVEKLRQREVPSLSSIEDKIILESMFASEDDMEKFVASIVKKFTKKKSFSIN